MCGGLQEFSVSPSPLGTNWGLELIGAWLGLGLGGLGAEGLGPGLDNNQMCLCVCPSNSSNVSNVSDSD